MNATIERHLRSDPVMDGLIERHGPLTIEPADNEFQRLCVSIINQQLSTASAAAIRGRVFGLFEGELTPEAMLAAEETRLLEAGLSATKVEYVQSVAETFLEDDLTRAGLEGHTDEEIVEKLTTIRGVGEWTAHMHLIFVMGREDVLPLGDLAIRKGIERIYGNGGPMDRSEMREIAEPWRPYRSYGTRYIWAEYESDS